MAAAYRWGKWVEARRFFQVPIRSLSRAHVRRIADMVSVQKKAANGATRERPDYRDLLNPFVGFSIESGQERAA